MARKWATDKEPLARQLDEIARENARIGEPMALLLFPEGTIVTANTRGISKKYADKTQSEWIVIGDTSVSGNRLRWPSLSLSTQSPTLNTSSCRDRPASFSREIIPRLSPQLRSSTDPREKTP
jgi:hypothetical protein